MKTAIEWEADIEQVVWDYVAITLDAQKELVPLVEQAMSQARLEGVRLGLEAAAKHLDENFERGWDYENSQVILKKPDASTGYKDGMSYDHEDLAVTIRALTPETVVKGDL